jgi:hypothetical protein
VGLKLEEAFMVIKANGSEKKANPAVGICRYLISKIVPPREIEALLTKEKHGATFATLEDNLVSNKTLTNAMTMRPDVFFRFTIAAKSDIRLTPPNI